MSNYKKHLTYILGVIGSGKSTSLDIMRETKLLDIQYLLEPVSTNSYLKKFYNPDTMDEVAAEMHGYLKAYKISILRNLLYNDLNRPVVLDYGIQKVYMNTLWRLNLISRECYSRWGVFDSAMSDFIPDRIIYINCNHKIAKSRIESRGRDFEQVIDEQYLIMLNDSYQEYLEEMRLSQIDIVTIENEGSLDELKTKINEILQLYTE